MKKLAGVLLTSVAMAAALATPSQADTFRLSIGAGQPADSTAWLATMRDWLAPEISRRVAERTEHRVEWVDAFGGTVCKMGECLEAVQSGLVDVADLHANFEPAKMIAHNFGVFVPFGAADPEIAAQAALAVYDEIPALKQILDEEYGQVFLAVGVVGNYNLATTFEWDSLDDLANRKIAAAGPNASWLTSVGAIPVQSSLTEAYTSLQTGVYDGWIMLADGVVGYKLHEVARTYTITDFGAVSNQVITINKRTWNGLPPEVQEIFLEVGREYTAYEAAVIADVGEAAIQTMRDSGATVRVLSAEDKAAWANALPNIPTERAAEIAAAGQPSETIAAYIKALTDLGVDLPRAWTVD